MTRGLGIIAMAFLLIPFMGVSSIRAQWAKNGTEVCSEIENQQYPQITPDGAGGAIVTWEDYRSSWSNVYAQKIDCHGTNLWTAGGVAISTLTVTQYYPKIIFDGSGGAIIAWYDYRGGSADIYAQKINAGGILQWTADGVAICTEPGNQSEVEITSDGAGGAIVTWRDERSGKLNIYAQRIDASGNVQWTAGGVVICADTVGQGGQKIIMDGSGGAIMAWLDQRNGNADIYAQRIDASGNVLWTNDGEAVCIEAGPQLYLRMASDSEDGAIITWADGRGSSADIYAQRIDAAGIAKWTTNGVPLCMETGDQLYPEITSDGAGGAIVTWADWRGLSVDIYAQKIDASGSAQWAANGAPVCRDAGNQLLAKITGDGSGGAIITWADWRGSSIDIYGQRVDANGNVRWILDGLAVCTADEDQQDGQVISNEVGGAIIAWTDGRGMDSDIYAQRIESYGHEGYYPAPYLSAVFDVPNDQGGKIHLQWERSFEDVWPKATVTHYSVWRRLPLSGPDPSIEEVRTIRRPCVPMECKGAVRYLAPNGYSWEWLTNMPARHFENYTLTVGSLYDSVGTDPGWQYYMVSAQTETSYAYYDSPIDSGYSVDNLHPCVPLSLAGKQSFVPAGLLISWNHNTEADLDHYAVYRGAEEAFVPSPGNRITSTCDTMCFDGEWQWCSDYFYKVAAVDVHGNESHYALLRPTDISGENIPVIPVATYLKQNYPNPFNPSTTIEFGLHASGNVSLRIYDAAGRLVRILVDSRREPGVYRESWDGRGSAGVSVGSGIYFCRLAAGDCIETRKLVLLQ